MKRGGRRLSRREVVALASAAAVTGVAGWAAAVARPLRDRERLFEFQAGSATPQPEAGGPTDPTAGAASPSFSNVAEAGPDEIVQYLAGKHPLYPGAGTGNFLGYSPADILESLDTVVLDAVGDRFGDSAMRILEQVVAKNLLDALLAVYGNHPVVLALDAGHGGKPGVYFDPGSNGTESLRTREVVAMVDELAQANSYSSITIRHIFNDAIGDDFGLPRPQDRKDRAQLVIRNARASMLAYEANAWNRSHPDSEVAVHMVSVHFNANSGGTLVLHEGDDVPALFQQRSIAFARSYVEHARPALNATGLLSPPLGLVSGDGLHDDSLMFAPPVRATGARVNPLTGNALHGPPRYAMLQASMLEADYVLGLLRYRGLAS
jgi:hypothetical protein